MRIDTNSTGLYWNKCNIFSLLNNIALILILSLKFDLFKAVYDLGIGLNRVDNHYICFKSLIGHELCTKSTFKDLQIGVF